MKTISSRQNSAVRAFRELAASPDAEGTRVLLDGIHLVGAAREAGADIEVVAVASSRLAGDTEEGALARALDAAGSSVLSLSDSVFAAVSPVRAPSGIVAIAHRKAAEAEKICRQPDGFTLVAADIQDPGNLGSMIRVAEAGGATGVLVCGTSANPFSWKALRGSMGSSLRLPIAAGLDVDGAVSCVERGGARLIGAVPRDGAAPDSVDWTGKIALLLGGEAAGLPRTVLPRCQERVTIPMAPPVESLNVAAATAVTGRLTSPSDLIEADSTALANR